MFLLGAERRQEPGRRMVVGGWLLTGAIKHIGEAATRPPQFPPNHPSNYSYVEEAARGERMLTAIVLTGKHVATCVAMIHEVDHLEPWSIALSEAPTVHRAFDYRLRCGIEPMFSDFTLRGFGIEDSRIQRTDLFGSLSWS
jgi:hypothetical protein